MSDSESKQDVAVDASDNETNKQIAEQEQDQEQEQEPVQSVQRNRILEDEEEDEEPKSEEPPQKSNYEEEMSELSELSDLDEEQFEEAPMDDDEVYKMGRHKRGGSKNNHHNNDNKPKIRQPRRRQGGTVSAGDNESDEDQDQKRSGKSKKNRGRAQRSRSADSDREQEVDLDSLSPEERARVELERKLDAALKPNSKRRKLDGDDIEMMQDEAIGNLRQQMKEAAMKDRACIDKGEPAIYKVEMLPQVRTVLQKQNLADSILDNNLLEAIRMWLEPLPDASLPSYEIQNDLFAALERLPIKTIHLRESSLGKVVLFYKKSTRPQAQIKRTAERLIGAWTRPIMGRSDNYRDKSVITRSYNPTEQLLAGTTGRVSTEDQKESLAEIAAKRRNRAAIPSARAVTFEVAPQSSVAFANQQHYQSQMDDQYKRIKQKLAATRSVKGKKSGVSIEGKELRS